MQFRRLEIQMFPESTFGHYRVTVSNSRRKCSFVIVDSTIYDDYCSSSQESVHYALQRIYHIYRSIVTYGDRRGHYYGFHYIN